MKYFVIAGEASGDLHGSNLISAIKARDNDARFLFLGGDNMTRAVGAKPIVHISSMAFMGFVAVIKNLRTIRTNTTMTQQALATFRPDKLILIDYPGFNLRLAKWAKRHIPTTEVIYYISPKLWAWKEYRIKSIRRYIDRMFTIFPFETEWYAHRGYQVQYVGNPTVDSVSEFKATAHTTGTHSPTDTRPIVALLPGSRLQEIKGCLPRMASLPPLFPDYRFVVAAAPGVDTQLYRTIVGETVEVIEASTYRLLSMAQAAIVNSGTATLETALFLVPQVVIYNVIGGRFTRILKNIILKTRYVSLVNIIAGREVVTELLADKFTVENMAHELRKLLYNDTNSAKMRKNYQEIARQLGPAGAAARCAELILS